MKLHTHSTLCALALVLGAFGCVGVKASDRFYVDAPEEATFKPVADVLLHRCGSLDCHGQESRNLRLYGHYGLRISKRDTPSGSPTTPKEYREDYLSVIGLEPESLTAVVDNGGENAGNLTLLEKPMGLQDHKGGTLIEKDDPQYNCIVSWISGSVDQPACTRALEEP